MLQRSPSYILSMPARNPLVNFLRRHLPEKYSGAVVRWLNALTTQTFYQLSRRRPQLVKKVLRKGLERELPDGYDIDTHFTPTYNPWDQRVCLVPDGDLFKAIRSGSASVVTDRIATFTETGLLLESGRELEADVIVTATGLEVLFLGGIDIAVDGEKVALADRLAYKGMMIEGVPNLAMALGYTNASWTLKCDLTCDYVCRLLDHMRSTGQRQAMAVNHDTGMVTAPVLGLTSGYVTRAVDRLPKQGSHYPWQVHQSYLRDYQALKRSGVEDDAMQFSNRSTSSPRPRAAQGAGT